MTEAKRKALIAANVGALATLAVVAAHQLGAVDHLPDPPGRWFASDEITGSKTAHPLGIPDGLLGIGSYGVTLGLAIAARNHASARKLLAAKLLADGSMAGFNVVRQVVSFGRICSWCTGTALCTAAMVWAGRGVIAGTARAELEEVRVEAAVAG
jgi:uncharacterized membrane protein